MISARPHIFGSNNQTWWETRVGLIASSQGVKSPGSSRTGPHGNAKVYPLGLLSAWTRQRPCFSRFPVHDGDERKGGSAEPLPWEVCHGTGKETGRQQNVLLAPQNAPNSIYTHVMLPPPGAVDRPPVDLQPFANIAVIGLPSIPREPTSTTASVDPGAVSTPVSATNSGPMPTLSNSLKSKGMCRNGGLGFAARRGKHTECDDEEDEQE